MKINENFVFREIAGEAMLIPLGEESACNGLLSLSGVGAEIWKCYAQGMDAQAVLAMLRENYDASEETLREDLVHFTQQLINHRVLLDEETDGCI